jgi:predicted O-linked N-acetylglucosamine transferase (SPINDLY family)
MTLMTEDLQSLDQQCAGATALQLAGQLDAAEVAYRKILEVDPEHAAANHCRGMLLVQRRRPNEGLPFLLKALEAKPQIADYWLGCLEALLQARRWSEAEETLQLAQGYGLPSDAHAEFRRRLDFAKRREFETRPLSVHEADLLERFKTGDVNGALSLAALMTEVHPSSGLSWKILGSVLWARDRCEESITAMTEAVSRLSGDAEAHLNLGMALASMGRLGLAEAQLKIALSLDINTIEKVMDLQLPGELALAERLYAHALLSDPAHVAANQQCGLLKLMLGKPNEAIKYFLVALTSQPENPELWLGYLAALRKAGQIINARIALDAARRLGVSGEQVDRFEQGLTGELAKVSPVAVPPTAGPEQIAREGELETLLARRRLADALRLAEQLVSEFPDSGTAWKVFGALSWDRERTVEAAQAMQKAAQLLPDSAEALTNFGSALSALNRYEEAESCLRQAVLLDPRYLAALYRLATHCAYHTRAREAAAIFRKALAMRSAVLTRDDAIAHSDLVFLASHDPSYDARALLAEHRHFQACVEAPLRTRWPVHDNSRKPDRRLRLGFVSGDFRWHAVAIFFEPILERLATLPRYELYGYSTNAVQDEVTKRMRTHFDHWSMVEQLLDHELAAKIRRDRIDILVDLSGHTALNRLAAFAHKPAPIQISWLGYPGSTGLEAMDYYFADAHWLPPGEYDELFTEKLVYLPDRWSYAPRDPSPDVAPLPALRADHFTFASFHQLRKLNVETIRLWAEVLIAVPDARLMLVGLRTDDHQEWLTAQFERYGVAEARLSFHRHSEFSEYLDLHGRVDVSLDAQPYCGGTTTMHALWMGVPTLTLLGGTTPGRAGAGIAQSVGLEAFVARSCEEFVAKAKFWATHRAELADLRMGLRARVRDSQGGHPGLMAAHIDRALRHVWRRWCAKLPAESFHSCAPDKPAGLPKLSKPDRAVLQNYFYPVIWGTSDNRFVTESVRAITAKVQSAYHFADNFFTWGRNNSLFEDAAFVTAWNSNAESESDKAIVWRRYILACAAYHCVQLAGDFVECGAYTGVGIKTVVDYLGGTRFPKTYWGYDLFEHDPSMAHHAMPDHGPGLYARVCGKFADYDNVKIVKGPIPAVFEGASPEKIAFLHIDLNEAPAELAALNALFDRMVPAGILILDDYEWAMAYRGQKLAEDPWFDARGYRVMPLPTGQGIVIKR